MGKDLSLKNQKRLSTYYGTWALVTGATSGLGKEMAIQLAKSKFNVVITARHENELETLSNSLKLEYGIQVDVVVADLSTKKGVGEILNATNDKDLGLAILNAGYGTSGKLLNSDIETELNMLNLNCKSVLTLAHYFGKMFSEKNRGGIILLSSIVGFQGVPFSANYAATKAYVLSLGEALYHELKPFNVDVLTACPGPVSTEFGKRAGLNMGTALNPKDVSIQILGALGKKSVSLPGWLTKLLVYSLRTVPRWGKVLIMKNVMAGMTTKP